MSNQILPTLDGVDKLMQCLLGEGCKAKAAPSGPDTSRPYVLARYADESGNVKRVLTCDLALANSLGAAFSMIPAAVANDATKAGNVPENIHMNMSEVLNVCVNLFTENSRERLTLSEVKVCTPKDPAPAVTQSAKFTVAIPRYAGGTLLAGAV